MPEMNKLLYSAEYCVVVFLSYFSDRKHTGLARDM